MVRWHGLSAFQKHSSKNEVSKYLLNVAYWLKTLQIMVSAFQIIAIFRKTNYFKTYCLVILDCMNLWQYSTKYSEAFI